MHYGHRRHRQGSLVEAWVILLGVLLIEVLKAKLIEWSKTHYRCQPPPLPADPLNPGKTLSIWALPRLQQIPFAIHQLRELLRFAPNGKTASWFVQFRVRGMRRALRARNYRFLRSFRTVAPPR